MIKLRRAFVVGIKGLYLTNKETSFLKKYRPWGIILFSRNINNINQVKTLTKNIRLIFKDSNYPILIDEEGGKVTRLKNFIDNSIFTNKFFAKLYKNNKKKFNIYLDVYVKQISHLLSTLGVNINTVPVLDLRRSFTNKVIGDRSFSSNPKIVSILGNYFISAFHSHNIGTIIKHIPGHGMARDDSHKKLPIVKSSTNYLYKNDFNAFINKKSLIAMTAHVIYQKIDPNNCATHSKKIINLIRKKIGYKNLIISDDLSMKALKYSMKKNTEKSFSAGCNLVLHCNGNFSEMIEVAENSPIVDNFIIKKTSQFINIVR